uniref:VOC family protein n=1 Tax=Thaumasiovibrio occultus TaxID=1891184 RepID=UPI000B35C689|nr:VOC family protein [Thaumasiovibrio occultus]
MKNRVSWFEIYVSDIEQAKAFYQTVFETHLTQLRSESEHAPEMWAFPWVEDAPGAAGAICRMRGVKPGQNSSLVYFECDDCAIEQGRIEAAGGKLICPKTSVGEYGFIAIATDPDGNTIGFHSFA